jgi:predicted transcriptional regulator
VKKTKRSLDLNVNRTTAAVVRNAKASPRLLDIAAQADAEEGIRQGREDVANGRVSPANEALKSIRREHGISS